MSMMIFLSPLRQTGRFRKNSHELDTEDMFSKEIREFISCVCSGKESEISSCQSVLNSMKIIDAEIKSTEDNGTKKSSD